MKAALIAKIAAGALAAGAAVAVGIVLLLPDGGTVGGQPQAWIDDPLHDSSVAPGTVNVVAHAADPAGVAAMEFAVDDAVQEVQDVPGAPTFWLASFDWATGQPGTVVIRIRARSSTGEWGMPAFATVHIGGPASTPTPTAPPTTAPTVTPPATATPATAPPAATTGPPATTRPPTTTTPPTTTAPPTMTQPPASPTPPPCTQLVAPDLASPPHLSTVTTVTPVLDWRYAGACTPDAFEVQVSRSRAFAEIDRFGTVRGSTTEWTVGPALADCTTYYWRVRAVTGRTIGAWSNLSGFNVAIGRCG